MAIAKIIKDVLFTEEQIKRRVSEMVKRIDEDFRSKDLVVIAVLKGSVVFLADLVRGFTRPLAFDFIGVSSYGNSTSSPGLVTLEKGITVDVADKSVLVVDDILDTGRSLCFVKTHLQRFKPREIKICVLLEKKGTRIVDVEADYVGFEIPNVFVLGYGLDYEDRYRHLPYIASLREEYYNELRRKGIGPI
ncbi:MAG: hypoxanthine phosphoribosyltransferase [bacterium]|nr:hypoxanthine phosphoribosyltransferase [bacterium]